MVQNQTLQVDSEELFLTGYIKEGANFAKGNHMKREPIDVGSAKIS